MASGTDRRILDALYLAGEVDIGMLSEKLQLPVNYVEDICNSLVEEGYLERTGTWEYRLVKSKKKKRRGPPFIVRY